MQSEKIRILRESDRHIKKTVKSFENELDRRHGDKQSNKTLFFLVIIVVVIVAAVTMFTGPERQAYFMKIKEFVLTLF